MDKVEIKIASERAQDESAKSKNRRTVIWTEEGRQTAKRQTHRQTHR
jgi:hypothetical protein